MNSAKNWIFYVFLGGGVALIAFSLWFSFSSNRNSGQNNRIALVTRETGHVTLLRDNYSRRDKVERLTPVYALDSIETNETGEAILLFENQYKIRLQDNTLVTLEQQPKEPTVLIIKKGEVQVLAIGRNHDLIIAKNGKRIAAQDYADSDLAVVPTSPTASTPTPIPNSSLTDEEISGVLSAQAVPFKKCYAQLLQKDEKAQGLVTLNFTIENNGKTSGLVIDSEKMNSEEFKKCLSDIVGRLSFRAYGGTKISTRYPLRFD